MANEKRPRSMSAQDAAEAVFAKKAKVAPPAPRAQAVPGARELVSVRIDQDVLAHFQADGPGWQDRMNAVLRTAIGLA